MRIKKYLKFFDVFRDNKLLGKLGNVSIAIKIGLAFMIIILLFGGSSLVVFNQASSVKNGMEELSLERTKENMITSLTNIFRSKNLAIANFITQDQKVSLAEYNTLVEEFIRTTKEVDELLKDETMLTLYDNLMKYNERMDTIFFNEVVPFTEKGDTEVALRSMTKTNNIMTSAGVSADQMIRIMDQNNNQIMADSKNNLEQSISSIFILLLISIIISVLVTIILSRNIKKNLANASKIADEVADGKLISGDQETYKNDEIGKVQQSINEMRGKIHKAITEIASVSDVVLSSSDSLKEVTEKVKNDTNEMAGTMQELAAGSESQVSSTENLKGFMNQLNEKVVLMNEQGQVINTISQTTVSMSEQGYEHMTESVNRMEEINQSVKSAVIKVENLNVRMDEITSLITIIQDISNQTNLLSLNATIEAARAGEHGKSFAVVATEVGNLANKVSESSSNITEIVKALQSETNGVTDSLKTSFNQVQKGTEQIKITGSSFDEIRLSFGEMEERIQQVITNVMEVSESSKVLEGAIESISAVSIQSAAGAESTSVGIQQTFATMEKLSEAALKLKQLSDKLTQVIKRFQI